MVAWGTIIPAATAAIGAGVNAIKGGGKSTQTTTQDIRDISAEGLMYQDMLNDAMRIAIEASGYKVEYQTTYQVKDEKKQAEYEVKKRKAQDSIDAVNKSIEKLNGEYPNKTTNAQYSWKLSQLNAEKAKYEKELLDIEVGIKSNSTEYQSASFVKDDPPLVKAAAEKYGADSQQVADARAQVADLEYNQRQFIAKADEAYVRDLNSILDKGFVDLPELNKFIDDSFGGVKDTFLGFYNKILDESKQSQTELSSYLDKVATEIDKSQFDVNSAMEAAMLQADKSKTTLLGVLEEVNSSAEKKAMFEFDLLSKKIDDQVDLQASMFGLPPTSKAVQVQKAQKKSEALSLTLLNLEQDKMNKTMGIYQDAEATKKEISLDAINFADEFGQKRIDLAMTKFGLAGDFEKLRLDTSMKAADYLVGLEQDATTMKMNAAFQPPSFGAVDAIPGIQQRLDESKASLFQALGFAEKQYDYAKQQQVAGVGQTTTTSTSPDLGSTIVGLGSTLANIDWSKKSSSSGSGNSTS